MAVPAPTLTPVPSGGSPLASGLFSLAGMALQNKYNKEAAQQAQAFSAQQSSTAHQREVVDLRAAGLNPILSGIGGAGAATSAGVLARQDDIIGPAISTALETRRNQEETKLMAQNILTSQAQESAHDMAATHSQAQAKLVIEKTLQAEQETSTARSVAGMSENQLYSSNIERRIDALSLEESRRIAERYSNTGLGLLGLVPKIFSKRQGKQRNPYAVEKKPNYKLEGAPY